jgi:hypothetical protein
MWWITMICGLLMAWTLMIAGFVMAAQGRKESMMFVFLATIVAICGMLVAKD